MSDSIVISNFASGKQGNIGSVTSRALLVGRVSGELKKFGGHGFITMDTTPEINDMASSHTGVGDAVGVPKSYWFVAITRRSNTEKAVAEQLHKLGYTSYVATQEEVRLWRNGKRAKVDRVVIPSVVFVRCTESERRRIVMLPFISRFMTDNAGMVSADMPHKPLAVVPDAQIKRLQFMLGESDTSVSFVRSYVRGQKVRVIRGRLCGLEGEISRDTDGLNKLYVKVDLCGCACMEIDPVNVEPVN